MAEVEKTTYLLVMRDDTLKKVTVPSSWKVTFGPLVPGVKGSVHNSSDGVALRFYAGKDQQKAVFTDVKSFRDMSIAVQERVTETRQERYMKQGDDKEDVIVAEVQVHKWQDPDAVTNQAESAPSTPGMLLRLRAG